MSARVPMGPIEKDPIEAYRGWIDLQAEQSALMGEALAGVDLGAYDRRIIEWMTNMLDQPTLVTIVSLIQRARLRSHQDGYNGGYDDAEQALGGAQ